MEKLRKKRLVPILITSKNWIVHWAFDPAFATIVFRCIDV